MPACSTTCSIARSPFARRSAGWRPTACRPAAGPCLKICSLISRCTMKSLISPCRRSTTSLGVPAGATTICHDAASNPGMPTSAIGARSGRAPRVPWSRRRARAACRHVDQAQRRRQVAEHQRDVAGGNVGERRQRASVGNVGHLDAGHALEQFREQMMGRAGSGRREGEPALLALGEPDEVSHRMHRQRRVDHQDIGAQDHQRERHEVGGRIVGQLLVQADVDRHDRARRHQDGVAVGRRAGGGDRPVRRRRRPVLDHERLAEPLLQPLPQQAGQEFRCRRRARTGTRT